LVFERVHDPAMSLSSGVNPSARSEVKLAVLDSVEELSEATDLFNQTWPAEVSVSTLRALRKIGNYVGGAYRDGVLVGACLAFFGSAGNEVLHSHLAVVAATQRSSGIGWALKVAQRAWALERGVTRIQWTYDPLEARNAYVNLTKLSARPLEYLENFYGEHGDGPGPAFPTDRLVVSWDLASPRVVRAAHGDWLLEDPALEALPAATLLRRDVTGAPREGRDHGEPVLLIAAPENAAEIRASDPSLALEWRMLLRHHLGRALEAGFETISFRRDGHYVVRRPGA